MSARNLIYEGQRQRAQDKSRQDWEERTRNDPTNPANWYRMSVEEDTVNRMADAENKRKMALQQLQESGAIERQKLVNTGNLGVAKLSDMGETTRRGMTEQGYLNRLGAENKYTSQRDREAAMRENINYWTRPQFDNTGMQTKGPVDPSLASKYASSMEDAINSYNNTKMESSNDKVYESVDAQGIRTFSNQPRNLSGKNFGLKFSEPEVVRPVNNVRSTNNVPATTPKVNTTLQNINSPKKLPYEGYTKANIQDGYVWGLDPKGNSRRMFEIQSPVYSSGLPNKNFPSYLDQMKRFNLPVNPEDNTKYQSAYDRMKNTNFSYR